MNTRTELLALIELSEKATPGPWHVSTGANDPAEVWQVADTGGGCEPVQVTIVADIMDYCRAAECDAHFIAALVNWFRSHAPTLATQPAPGGGDVEYEFEVWQGNECQAGGSAPTAHECGAEAAHYAAVYGQDGPVDVRYYEKREIDMTTLATPITAQKE